MCGISDVYFGDHFGDENRAYNWCIMRLNETMFLTPSFVFPAKKAPPYITLRPKLSINALCKVLQNIASSEANSVFFILKEN